MTKVLLIGSCPMPYEAARRLSAHGTRTWQFACSLLQAGHEVTAVCLKDHEAYFPGSAGSAAVRRERGMTVHALDVIEFEKMGTLQRIHDEVRPQCIVTSSSSLPSYLAALLSTEAPLWIDQNGDLMAEAQMLAATNGDDKVLTLYATYLAQILARGDLFSASSHRQRYALVGELAARGRLNGETAGYEFVRVIPNASDGEFTPTRNVIRGPLCGKNDFVILWSGGFNVWTDVDTLSAALEDAMAARETVQFVATGGGLPGLVESTYRRFEEMVAASLHRGRYHLVGWVPQADLADYYLEADLGINIDRPCYETELGSRTRILSWWRAGLPVLTTAGCELVEAADRIGAVATFPQGDARALASEILSLAADDARRAELARRAGELVRGKYSFAATAKPLLDWVATPTHAPDYASGRTLPGLDAEVLRHLEGKVSSLRDQLDRIRSSRSWKLVSKLHGITKRLGFR